MDFSRWASGSAGARNPLEGSSTAVPKTRGPVPASAQLPGLPQRPAPTPGRLRREASRLHVIAVTASAKRALPS